MPRVRLYQVDVFTRERFAGNPAGVVLGADELDAYDMQRLARELNNSETAFMLRPSGDDHDVRIRYFTPTVEVPSCGHATIAAHYVRAIVDQLPRGRVWHRIGIGRLPVDIEHDGIDYSITMTQGAPVIHPPLSQDDCESLLAALGLGDEDLTEDLPIQRVDTGNSKYLVPLRTRARLNMLTPNYEALRAFAAARPNGGVFVFTLNDNDPDVRAHARMFAPQIGILEDPVTGNGNGPLGAYLVHHGLLAPEGGAASFSARQGEAMGRPGVARVWVGCDGDVPREVRVSGDAVLVFTARVDI